MAEQSGKPEKDRAADATGSQGNAYAGRVLTAVRRIIRAMDVESRRLTAEYQITGPQMVCLLAVVQDEPLTATEIGNRVHLSASTVVGIIDRLEAKGMLVRRRDQTDRRLVHIRATERARALVAHAPFPLQRVLDTALGRLSKREQQAIADSLEQLVELIDRDVEQAAAEQSQG